MRRHVRAAVGGLGCSAWTILAAETALGHGSTPEPDLTTWSADPLPWIGSLLAASAYVVAVRRVNRTNPRVPIRAWRVASWLAGVVSILLALVSPIDAYATDLLAIHMVQHLLLAMVAPPLLALGAPVTLILRIASTETRRRLLLPILHSRLVRAIASPFIAWPLFAAVMWLTHFSPLYEGALEDPAVHVAEHALYLATGILFWWPVVAADPIPRRLGYGARLAYVGLQMPVNAAVGLAIYFAPAVLYPHYATLARTWGPDALTDQQVGGVLMWGVGDVILLAIMPALVVAWMRADARRSLRSDRRRAATDARPVARIDDRAPNR